MVQMMELSKEDALRELVSKKEAEGLEIMEWQFTKHHDVHAIFHRPIDESYIVWTAYYDQRGKMTYASFYNGAYDMTLSEARKELARRMN